MLLLKKIFISLAILAVGVAGYQWLNADQSPSRSQPGASSSAVSAPSPNADEATKADSETPTPSSGEADKTNAAAVNNESRPAQNSNRGGMRGGRLAQQAATSVELLSVAPSQQNAMLSVYGVIEAEVSASIRSPSAVTVASLSVMEGQSVQSGQALALLTSDDLPEQLTQREAALRELDARIRNEARRHENDLAALAIEEELVGIAKNAVDRFTSLNRQQLTSNTDYEAALRTYQNQLLSLQSRQLTIAQYDDSQAQLQAQREQLLSQIRQTRELIEDLNVRAPFSGLVAQIHVKSGQSLNASDAVIDLYDPESLTLSVRVPVKYRLDQTNLSSLVAEDGQGNRWRATAIRPLNQSGAQQLTFTAATPATNRPLPGSYLALTLTYPVTSLTVEVPVTAVYDQQRLYIYDPKQQGIQAADITVVGQTETGYLVTGLDTESASDIVITRLKNPVSGMKVSVVDNKNGQRS